MKKFVACMLALCVMSCSVPVVAEDTTLAAVEAAPEEIQIEEEVDSEEVLAVEEDSDFVIEDTVLVEYVGQDTEVTVPEEVTEIGEEAFAGNEKIESVYFAGDVVKIGEAAFEDCINLEEISFADIDKLETIESNAFAGCEKLNRDWAADVKDVADDAFGTPAEIEPETDADETEINEAVAAVGITSQPQDVELTVGETAEFKVVASGEGLSYSWQILKAGSTVWSGTTMPGNKTDTLSVEARIDRNGNQYRCVVTDAAGNKVTSEPAMLTVTESNAFEITSQPKSVELAVGETAKFTVAATGNGLTYRWYICKPGGTWAVTSMTGNRTDTLSVGVTTERNGYQYRCVVTDASGNSITSEAAMLTVIESAAFEITSQPKSVEVNEGETAKFTVAATGNGLTYRWYICKPGGTWAVTTMPGNRTATLSVEAKLDRNGYQYRCVVTNAAGETVTSEAAAMTVKKAVALEITTQPKSVSMTVGQTAKFTVAANDANATYRWEILKAGSTTWSGTTMPGNRTATLSVEAKLDRSGNQYRCVVTDAAGNTAISEPATLTVTEAFKITSQPKSVSMTVGQTAEFTVVANGENLTYRWEILKAGSTAWSGTTMPGNRTATLSVEAKLDRSGNQYRCVVTDASGNVVTSKAATLTVVEELKITSQPQSVELGVGEMAEFTVKASGSGLTYRWYICKPGGDWAVTSMPGNRTATLSVEAKLDRSGNQYRCVVTDAAGNTVTSDAAMLTVVEVAALEIISQPQSVELNVGETAEFTVAANGDGLTYRWYLLKPGSENWAVTSMEGNRTATLKVGATLERNGYQYRCIVTDARGNTVTSDAAMLTVAEVTPLEIISQPQSVELAVGETAEFTVEANGDGLTYRWYLLKPGSENWAVTSMEGNRTATLKVGVTAERNGYQYHCVITDASGNSVTSEPAMLTVVSDITLDDVVYEKISETTVSIKSYNGSAATVVIPETVEGYTVVAIGESAFEGNTTLTSIDLPDTIEVIGKYAFKNCTSLSTMN